ncbi:copper resistance protein CopC [uncultured Amnibacterium sp.]|uniref:copper resistance CopC/CopD family protein n=1 Tax=uncultured Amnibacterium sp. TaxID=1631851 RepID=UPI0035CA3FE6
MSPAPRRLAAALLLALAALLLLPATPASAHAVLVSSDPADGARVAAAPAVVRLTFDEAVALPPDATTVLSSTGVRIQRGAATLDGRTVVIPLQAEVPAGVYSVSWRVVSADSHLVTGSIRFGVRRDADAVEGPVSTGSPLDSGIGAATGAVYLGLALGIGVPASAALLWPSVRRRRRVLGITAAGLVLVLLASLADLLLRGPRAAGGSWPAVLRLEDLGYTVTSAIGIVLLARVGLVLVLAVLLRRAGVRRDLGAGVVGVAVLASVALLGHATDGAAWLLVPAAVLHLAAMALWLGGLVVLVTAVLPRFHRAPAAGLRALRRWSVVAFACIGVLVVTGEVQAFPTVVPLAALWSTDYGVLLLVKLGLVAALIVVATVAQRAVAGSDRPVRTRVRRAVVAEAVGVVAILGVTAALGGTATAAETYGPAVTRTVAVGADRLVVDVDRTRRGAAVLHVQAVAPSGAAVRLQTLEGSLSTTDVAALDVTFRRDGDGWRSTDATLPVSGEWTLALAAEVSATSATAAEVSWPVW